MLQLAKMCILYSKQGLWQNYGKVPLPKEGYTTIHYAGPMLVTKWWECIPRQGSLVLQPSGRWVVGEKHVTLCWGECAWTAMALPLTSSVTQLRARLQPFLGKYKYKKKIQKYNAPSYILLYSIKDISPAYSWKKMAFFMFSNPLLYRDILKLSLLLVCFRFWLT